MHDEERGPLVRWRRPDASSGEIRPGRSEIRLIGTIKPQDESVPYRPTGEGPDFEFRFRKQGRLRHFE